MWRFTIALIFLFILIRVFISDIREGEIPFQLILNGDNCFFYSLHTQISLYRNGNGFGLFAVFSILRAQDQKFHRKGHGIYFYNLWDSLCQFIKLVKFPLLGVLIINIIIVLAAYLLEEFCVEVQD